MTCIVHILNDRVSLKEHHTRTRSWRATKTNSSTTFVNVSTEWNGMECRHIQTITQLTAQYYVVTNHTIEYYARATDK